MTQNSCLVYMFSLYVHSQLKELTLAMYEVALDAFQ